MRTKKNARILTEECSIFLQYNLHLPDTVAKRANRAQRFQKWTPNGSPRTEPQATAAFRKKTSKSRIDEAAMGRKKLIGEASS